MIIINPSYRIRFHEHKDWMEHDSPSKPPCWNVPRKRITIEYKGERTGLFFSRITWFYCPLCGYSVAGIMWKNDGEMMWRDSLEKMENAKEEIS